jgi:AraC-like DNA-binding protein
VKAIPEKILHPQDDSFACFDFELERFQCPFHYHPEIELTLIVASTGQRFVGDHIARFAAGDLVLMGPNLPHMYFNDSTFSGRARSVVLQFLPEFLGEEFMQRGELRAIQALLERSGNGLVFRGQTRDTVAPMMERLVQLEGFERLMVFLRILQILAAARDEGQPLASRSFSPSLALYQGERINRVCELISRKFRDDVTQKEAARLAQMSVPSFSRFFRRVTNRTFRAFLNEVRIGHAAQSLLETDRTVAEICYECGYSNLSNFNRQFLRLRKVSPRDYRRLTAGTEIAEFPADSGRSPTVNA